MRLVSPIAVVVGAAVLISGCKSEGDQAARHGAPRPVLSVVAKAASDRDSGFAGTIEPRYQTERGFRVLGRLVGRDVDVGDVLNPGQRLAQLYPFILDLAVRSSEADLTKARAQLSNASSAEARANTLLGRQVLNQADFDTARQAREAGAIGDATIEQRAPIDPDRVEEERDRAGRLDRGGERPLGDHLRRA